MYDDIFYGRILPRHAYWCAQALQRNPNSTWRAVLTVEIATDPDTSTEQKSAELDKYRYLGWSKEVYALKAIEDKLSNIYSAIFATTQGVKKEQIPKVTPADRPDFLDQKARQDAIAAKSMAADFDNAHEWLMNSGLPM